MKIKTKLWWLKNSNGNISPAKILRILSSQMFVNSKKKFRFGKEIHRQYTVLVLGMKNLWKIQRLALIDFDSL